MTLLAYAFSIAPYKDEELFMERYMALSVGQGEEYSKLRDEMLTPKYQLQDYGGYSHYNGSRRIRCLSQRLAAA